MFGLSVAILTTSHIEHCISTAVAGSAPTSVTSGVSTWSVTTNQSGAKITGSVGVAMPAGVTLSANLVAPAGATSAGLKPLTTVAVDLRSPPPDRRNRRRPSSTAAAHG